LLFPFKDRFLDKSISNEVVVQSNKLIEAHYRLSLQEKRLILWLIKEIDKSDTDFKRYHLKITDFAEIMDLNPKTQYKEMRRITRSLITRPIEIENHETDSTIQMAWLCFSEWKPKNGSFSVEFHPALKPYLLQLKSHFTKIGFADFLGLRSVYSVRLFELLAQYESIGSRTMKISDIRSWCGIQEEEYQLYADLKRKVLNRARDEINAKTEYEVDYREIKESRKVVAIEWTMNKKTHFEKIIRDKVKVIQKEITFENPLMGRIMGYGFSKPTARKYVDMESSEVLTNALRAVDIQVEKGGVTNPKAMLKVAIKEQWKPDVFKSREKTQRKRAS